MNFLRKLLVDTGRIDRQHVQLVQLLVLVLTLVLFVLTGGAPMIEPAAGG
ncbi:MAG: hypothetical protein R3248_09930 [Candidatus Promineifilaceae bacterium]|nr:hypothetical protein [Candidatus Promineifilaceae bacterium]